MVKKIEKATTETAKFKPSIEEVQEFFKTKFWWLNWEKTMRFAQTVVITKHKKAEILIGFMEWGIAVSGTNRNKGYEGFSSPVDSFQDLIKTLKGYVPKYGFPPAPAEHQMTIYEVL